MRILTADGTEVCSRCVQAHTPLARLRGLLGRPPLAPGAGLLLTPCASVHTVLLRRPIEVVFLGARGDVLRIVPALAPWRFAGRRGAHSVLELPPGTCGRLGVRPGDVLLSGA